MQKPFEKISDLEECLRKLERLLLQDQPHLDTVQQVLKNYLVKKLSKQGGAGFESEEKFHYFTPITDRRLGLTTRQINSLESGLGVLYLGQLLEKTRSDLLMIPMLEVDNICTALSNNGLKFGMILTSFDIEAEKPKGLTWTAVVPSSPGWYFIKTSPSLTCKSETFVRHLSKEQLRDLLLKQSTLSPTLFAGPIHPPMA